VTPVSGGPISRRLAVVAGTLLAAAGLAVLTAAPAWAHAEPAGSIPSDGSTVDNSPDTLDLRLTESVELAGTKVSLVDGSGRVLSTGKPELLRVPNAGPKDASTLRVPLPVLPPDTYRVSWTTLSSDDLHTTAGTLVFGVQRPVAPAVAALPADPLPSVSEVIAQGAIYLGLGGWMGAMVLLALFRTRDAAAPLSATARSRLLKVGAVAAGVGAAGGIALLLVRATGFDGGPIRTAWLLLTGSSVGPPWLARECAAAAMVTLALSALRKPAMSKQVLFGCGAALALTAGVSTALLGHLSTSGPLLLTTDTLHVLATMVWAGTVIAAGAVLLRARGEAHRELVRAVLSRFGLIATSALTVLVATGLLLAADRVASVDALLLSTYGRTLLIKVALVALAALAGLLTTLSLHGRRRTGRRTRRTVLVEMSLLTGVLLMTAGLVSTHQASGPQWRPPTEAAVQGLTSANVDDLVQTLSVRPNLPGRNFITVNVFDTRRPAPAPVQAVLVTLRGPDGTTVTRAAGPAAPNSYLLATDDVVSSGPWEITVTAVRPQLAPASGAFTWVVPPAAVVVRQPVVSLNPLTPYTGWLASMVLLIGVAAMALLLRRRTRRGRSEPARLDSTQLEPTQPEPPRLPTGVR
jgi:copper transport protein